MTPAVQNLVKEAAKTPSKKNANAEKAARILGKNDSAVIEAEKIREQAISAEEARKKAADEKLQKQTGVYKNKTASDNSNAK